MTTRPLHTRVQRAFSSKRRGVGPRRFDSIRRAFYKRANFLARGILCDLLTDLLHEKVIIDDGVQRIDESNRLRVV